MKRFKKVLRYVGLTVLGLIGLGLNAVLFLFVASYLIYGSHPIPPVLPLPSTAELLQLVNTERAKVGVAPLTIDSRLNQSAQFKADDMTARNYYAHADPNTGGLNGPAKAFELTGQQCSSVSENIVENAVSSQGAISAWVGSTSHYTAMVNPNNKLTGFGISGGMVVEHFCIPR